MKSLKEKMHRAWVLAINADPDRISDQDLQNDVYAYQDGLWHKYLSDRLEGRCSLAELFSFDVAQLESEIDKFINRLEALDKHKDP